MRVVCFGFAKGADDEEFPGCLGLCFSRVGAGAGVTEAGVGEATEGSGLTPINF